MNVLHIQIEGIRGHETLVKIYTESYGRNVTVPTALTERRMEISVNLLIHSIEETTVNLFYSMTNSVHVNTKRYYYLDCEVAG